MLKRATEINILLILSNSLPISPQLPYRAYTETLKGKRAVRSAREGYSQETKNFVNAFSAEQEERAAIRHQVSK